MATDPIRALVTRLVADDVHLYVDGAELKYRARKGAIHEADRKRVKDNKAAIIEYLGRLREIENDQSAELPPIDRIARDSAGSILSHGQQRLWFIDQLEGGSAHYNSQFNLLIGGELEIVALEDALAALIERHEILRTCYVDVCGEPRQVVQDLRRVPLTHRHPTAVDDHEKQMQIQRWMQEDIATPFDLRKGLVVRASLIALAPDASLLVVTVHHIATDGWSTGIFEREFRELYEARRSGRPARLDPLRIQYADYAAWQRGWLQQTFIAPQLQYWKKRLKGAPLVHGLPLDRGRPFRQTFTGKLQRRFVSAETLGAIKAICQANDVTSFIFLHTVFALLLGRYSRQNDIVVGVPLVGRIHQDLENMLGFFVNLLVLRTDLSGMPTFRELLERNRKVILEAHENQYAPFELIVEQLCPERTLSHNALAQILFDVQSNEHVSLKESGGGSASISTRYDLKLDVLAGADGLMLTWLYNDALFADDSIRRLAEGYEVLLANVVEDMSSGWEARRNIESLELVGVATRNELVANANVCIDRGRLVHGMFEAQVAAHPRAIAVTQGSEQLTYEELNTRANRLAHLLLEKGVEPDSLVALSVKRSIDMLVGLLAILKSGAAYVPVDPDLPEARLSYLMDDCNPRLVLTRSDLSERFAVDRSRVVCLDDLATLARLDECAASNLRLETVSPDNLAYAIYTSGSTGKPKGVLVTHDNVCDFLAYAVADFLPDHVKGAVVSSTLSFDATVGSLLVPICGGRYAKLLPDDAFVLDHLSECLSDEKEAMLYKLTPSHLDAMAVHGQMRRSAGARHVLVVAGEALLPITLAHWSIDLLPSSLFINEYGPTETTVGSTTHRIERPMDFREGNPVSVPIGKAFGDMQVHVLNDELCLQCPGGIGELYIGGAGVARGYLNRPALTAQRFVPDPFGTRAGSRLYRTGDLARRLADGAIEYIGRIDHQVKIRGIRIELGEIESNLLQLAEVAEAVVLSHPDAAGGARLTAYLVLDVSRPEPVDDAATKMRIRDQLSQQLPAYMVPEVYVLLEHLPLNDNGKIDRAALPKPSDADSINEAYVPPSNKTEEALCRLWQHLLRVERVGVYDNFFSLGGHSLLATRLVSAIRQEFGLELELRALFESPTVAALSRRLGAASPKLLLPPVTRIPRDRPLPLSFSQQRLWFIDQLSEDSAHYNLPGYFLLQGQFREDVFRRALKSLMDRHEVLRTRFGEVDGEARQIVVADYELRYTRHDLSGLPDERKLAEARRLMEEEAAIPFDLGRDLMLRVRCMPLADDVHLIVYTLHHIVSDGWSRAIFQRELSALYAAYSRDEPDPLPPLTIQYADYAAWQRRWLQGGVFECGVEYWRKQLSDLPAVHGLPLDKPRPVRQRHIGRSHEVLIGAKLAAAIADFNRRQQTTLFMFMHTALAVLLSRCSGQRDIVIGSATSLRTHREVEGLIGFFINDLVLRIQIDGARGFTELLRQHRETILDAYAHQYIPFELLVEELNPPRSMSHDPLFQIKLDVQNNEEARLSLPDLELLNTRVETQRRPMQEMQHEHRVRQDLYLSVSERADGLSVIWRYSTDLFLPETIARWSEHFETLLAGIVAAPELPVHSQPLLTREQEQDLLIAGQGPQPPYPRGRSIHQLFEEQVKRSPDDPAVVATDGMLTYRQLNCEANRLAHYLLAQGAGPGSRVALCMERSTDMVVGLLGILKAGAAYLPLDPAHPPARLKFMLEDSDCRWVLTQGELMSAVSLEDQQVLPIDAPLRASLLKGYGEDDPAIEGRGLTAKQLAYLIYTSGSTGQPKGVMVEHEGVVKYCDHARERYYAPDLCGSLLATSHGFDLTVPALYLPLLSGGHVRLLEEGREIEELAELLIGASRPYLLRLTPSHLAGLIPLIAGRSSECAHSLVVGGEALPMSVVHSLRSCLPRARLYNHYGPTESIVGCSLLPLTAESSSSWSVGAGYCPIGTALGHKQLLVLSEQLRLQPRGTPGQLYVAGEALARGYLNRPALTARKFLANPYSVTVGGRMYATGDLVRWRADGNLEFLGRLDQQVKVRGLRIELGEIEQGLLSLPGVRECAVTVSGAGEEQRLVAYVVPDQDPASGAEDDAALIQRKERLTEGYRDGLGSRLPIYMVPQVYIFLSRLPLTVHGKLDRDRLPAPVEGDLLKSRYEAPRNVTEQRMCALWQQVLKIGQVGIEDNFFLLGGHSLLAARLVNLIRQEFGVELPLRALFESPTVATLSELLGAASPTLLLPPVTPVPRDGPLPLSFSQQRMWFIDQLGEGSAHYNLPGYFLLQGRFREEAFVRALKAVVDRHEVLRTRFVAVDGEARQVIAVDYELPFTRHDLSMLSSVDKQAEVQRLMGEEARTPFDLGRDSMLRVHWVALAEDVHLVIYTLHHIATDGWSRGIFQRELSALYAAYSKDEPNPLPPLSIQYADYAVWQRQSLSGEVLARALAYWKKQLAGLPAVHSLPLDKPRPPKQRHLGRTHELLIGTRTAGAIADLNRRHQSTLFMFMHTALAVLLSRWSGERDIVVGGSVMGRAHRDVEGLIGFFVNDLVLRMQVDGRRGFGELLKQHRETILDAYAHQHVPFEMLVEELNPPRSLSHDPLFQIKLDVQNNEDARLSLADLELLNAQVETRRQPMQQQEHEHHVRHDLYVSVTERPEGLSLSWRYSTDLFLPETISRWCAYFERLIEGIVAAPEMPVRSIPLLTQDERRGLRSAPEGPGMADGPGKCLHQLFEDQVERSPDVPAVVAPDGTLTFRQLNQHANRIAHYLMKHGVQPGSRVALCTERSADMMVGLIGILKAGAAYLPLDPAHPPARLQYMLEDSDCRWVLARGEITSSTCWGGRHVLPLDAPRRAALLESYCDSDPVLDRRGLIAKHLAYVIYTSGSTGRPKGVMVEHEGVVRYCHYARQRYYAADLAGSLLATSYGFDLTVPALYLPLLTGGHVRLLAEGRELEELAEILFDAPQPHLLRLTPSHVAGLLPLLAARRSACPHVLVIGGEALPAAMVRAVRASLPCARIYNHYGPTESIVGCSVLPLSEKTEQSSSGGGFCPIGAALGDRQLLVLDDELQLQPWGAPGELHVGGETLARGYLDQPALTALRFRSNPFSASPGSRMYATGDRVRWRADGNLEFLGRLDQQVKLSGLRIELGEIEQGLQSLPGVRECAVKVSVTGEDQRLVAYLVSEEEPGGGAEDDAESARRRERSIRHIRDGLGRLLPHYMVPQVFVFLPRLPVTAHGKLDREALPAPDERDLVKSRYVAPRTHTEEKMCSLWREVLAIDRVGIEDDFFLLGGHSLLAARLVNLIRQEFTTELPLRALFESPTVAGLSERMAGTWQAPVLPPVVRVSRDRPLPLSFSQQRLWFIDQLGKGSAQYNMPGSYLLEGRFDARAFEQALRTLMERHEVLRTRFVEQHGEPRQFVVEDYALPLQLHDLSQLNDDERACEAQRLMREEARLPFDLERDLMLRLRVLKLSESRHLVLYTMHHIASDRWSRGILTKELGALYNAYSNGNENPLRPLDVQYADYAQWQRSWLQGEVLERQLSYWREQLKDLPPLLKLPTDHSRPSLQTFRGSKERIGIPAELASKLRALGRQNGATLFMTLLSAFAVLMGRHADQRDVTIGTPIANRTRKETEGLIGFLLNTLVMRHDLRGDPRFVDLLRDTREMALQAYAHQDLPFDLLVEKLNPERSLSHTPLFQVMFILQNAPFDGFGLPGLVLDPLGAESLESQGGDEPGRTARYDLTLSLQETPAGLLGSLEYNTDLFERGTIRRMLEHYARLLAAIVESPQARLSQLEMLGDRERRQQLIEWNGTRREYPADRCIQELFEEQAQCAPDRVALVQGSRELTYGELNERANELARELVERGVGAEGRVGLCLPRSAELVIGMLGILKAGGCYVPLDPDYPRKRLEYLLEDARIELVVTETGVAERVSGAGRHLLLLDAIEAPRSTGSRVEARSHGLHPEHPAYLIYTSASTGTPKGVLGLHRGVVNRVRWLEATRGVRAGEVLCQKTSVGFVDHVAEIFQALSAGVPLVILAPELVQEPRALLRELDTRRVTQLTVVPSLLKTVLEDGEGEQARWIESIHCSGEALHASGLERLAERFPRAQLFNIYGSTEVAADVTCQAVELPNAGTCAGQWAPIGKPIDNIQVYLLNSNGELAVSGAVGELYVGGVCLARGYFRRAGITAEKFAPHPFAQAGERLYRTGDLARWRADGVLEYLGRADTQVKVRGQRIELGEIESALRAQPGVREAVVVVRQDSGDPSLVGYVVPGIGVPADEAGFVGQLRARLRDRLPSYLVPSALVVLEALPLMPNGKLDRQALPAPTASIAFAPPEGPTEELLAQLWCVLLKRERVGRHDNFFELGGHSLLAVRLARLIRQEFATELPLQVLFESPTVASLSEQLSPRTGVSTQDGGAEWVTGSL